MNKDVANVVGVALLSDIPAEQFTWFAVEADVEYENTAQHQLLAPMPDLQLPVPRLGVVLYRDTPKGRQLQSAMYELDIDGSLRAAYLVHDTTSKIFMSRVYIHADPTTWADIEVHGPDCDDGKFLADVAELTLGVFAEFLHSMKKRGSLTGRVVQLTATGRRQIAKKKKPLIKWSTVEVAPPKPRSAPLGGTHASPRLHQRRGHERTTKSGLKVWVRDCVVGSASNGIGFHDYQVSSLTKEKA